MCDEVVARVRESTELNHIHSKRQSTTKSVSTTSCLKAKKKPHGPSRHRSHWSHLGVPDPFIRMHNAHVRVVKCDSVCSDAPTTVNDKFIQALLEQLLLELFRRHYDSQANYRVTRPTKQPPGGGSSGEEW